MENLYKVFKTSNDLLFDRGYNVKQTRRNITFEEFIIRYKSRSKLNYLTEKRDNGNDKILLLHMDKFTKKEIRVIYVLLAKKHISRCIVVLFTKNKINNNENVIIEKLKELGYIIEIFLETDLLSNVTKSKYVPKHVLLKTEHVETLLRQLKVSNPFEDLPKILITDSQSKYYGAQKGDIFKILRPSETTGITIYYRIVI